VVRTERSVLSTGAADVERHRAVHPGDPPARGISVTTITSAKPINAPEPETKPSLADR
jgi:hypothetical protein